MWWAVRIENDVFREAFLGLHYWMETAKDRFAKSRASFINQRGNYCDIDATWQTFREKPPSPNLSYRFSWRYMDNGIRPALLSQFWRCWGADIESILKAVNEVHDKGVILVAALNTVECCDTPYLFYRLTPKIVQPPLALRKWLYLRSGPTVQYIWS